MKGLLNPNKACSENVQCLNLSWPDADLCSLWLFPKVCYREDGAWADCVQTYSIGERSHVLLSHSKWFAASNKSNDTGENSCEEMDSSECAGE